MSTRSEPVAAAPRSRAGAASGAHGGPLVFAHRGSSAELPEHTLAAYLRAIEEGADGLECDVRLSRDGHLVCVHDRRLERTSNGRGAVRAHTLAELESLDYGSWHPGTARGGGGSDPARTRLLTLEILLGAVRAAGRQLELLIETKHPTRNGADVERQLVTVLNRHGLADPRPDDPVRVTVMSFSPLAIRRIRRLAPGLSTVLLLAFLPPGMGGGRLPYGARIAGPNVRLLTSHPGLVSALHAAGNRVYVWTVNDETHVDLAVAREVDGIITDRPAMVLTRLGR